MNKNWFNPRQPVETFYEYYNHPVKAFLYYAPPPVLPVFDIF